jgi:hypothetical protein
MNFVKTHHVKLFIIFCNLFAGSLIVGGTLGLVIGFLGIPFGVAACIGVHND